MRAVLSASVFNFFLFNVLCHFIIVRVSSFVLSLISFVFYYYSVYDLLRINVFINGGCCTANRHISQADFVCNNNKYILIQDLYSAMESEDTEALGGARLRQVE